MASVISELILDKIYELFFRENESALYAVTGVRRVGFYCIYLFS